MPVIKVDDLQSFEQIIEEEDNVLVKFGAEWCKPCDAMAPVVEEIANQNPDVRVLSIDIEGEGIDFLLKEYKVQSVPTFIHLKKGAKVNSACGTMTKKELSSMIQEG